MDTTSTDRTARELSAALEGYVQRRRAFALSVKSYEGPEDLSAEAWAELRSELGLEGETLPPKGGAAPLPFGPEWMRARFEDGSSSDFYEGPLSFAGEQAWESAAEHVREVFADCPGRGVELVQDGRSGGWAVLSGLDSSDVVSALEDFGTLEETRDRLGRLRAVLHYFEQGREAYALRLAAEHGLQGSTRADFESARATSEDALARLAGELVSSDFGARVSALVELVRFERARRAYPNPVRGDAEHALELRRECGLSPTVPIPEPDELEVPEDEGTSYSLDELRRIVSALESFRDFARSEVEDFPRLVAWHAGANVYERELQEWKEEQTEDEEARAKGRELRELAESARALLAGVARVRELADVEPGAADSLALLEPAERVLSAALEGVADWPVAELRVSLGAEGRRPAAPCAGCGTPVRFKWGSSEDRCGECQSDEDPPCGRCQGKEHGAQDCPHGDGEGD